jgi:hypothetical protein
MEPVAESTSPAVYSPTSTPILDVLRPLPKGERWNLSAGEVFFLSSAFIFSLIIAQAVGPLPVDIAKPAALLFVLMAGAGLVLLAVGVHETGHFMAAWLVGFRPVLSIFKKSQSFGQKLRGSEVMAFGCLAMRPKNMEHLPRRLFMVSAGGPLASLLFPIVLENISFKPAWLPNCLHFLAACSVLLGIASLLPDLNRSGKFSDGARLVMLLKNDARAQRWLSIVPIVCAWREGTAPQLWPQSWIEAVTARDDDSRDAINANWLAYLWATERQDTTRATSHLEAALGFPEAVLRQLRKRVLLEAAIFQAWFRENPALARLWAGQLGIRSLSGLQRQRLQIALLWADGQLFDAQEKLSSYLADLTRLPQSAECSLAESGAREWKRQMESRMLTRAWRNIYSKSQQVESAVDALPVSR